MNNISTHKDVICDWLSIHQNHSKIPVFLVNKDEFSSYNSMAHVFHVNSNIEDRVYSINEVLFKMKLK